MKLSAILALCCFLGITAYQDFRYRSIPLYCFAGIFASSFAVAISHAPLSAVVFSTLQTISLLALLLGGICLYIYARYKTLRQFVNNQLGTGDILFWVAIAAAFHAFNYLLFMLLSLMVTLLVHIAGLLFTSKRSPFIPLAGIQACCLLVFVLLNEFVLSYNYFAHLPAFLEVYE